jgi:hypothetical protein
MRLAILLVLSAACGDVVTPLADAPPAPGDDAATAGDGPPADATIDAPPPCAATLFTRDATTQMLYALNEGTSTLAGDSSGHNRDGRFAAAVSTGPTWTDGKFGGAVAFSGGAGFAGDRIDIPLSPVMVWGAPFSVEMVVKPSATDPDGVIVGVNPAFALWSSTGGRAHWRLNNSGANLLGPTLDPSRWSYVAATYDGSTMRVYVDGVLAGSQALTSTGQNTTATAYLGCAPNDGCYGGLLDEVRVSSVALTAVAIASTASRAAACE